MSISSIYVKDKSLGIKCAKTFNVPRDLLHIEDGFNVRDIDPEHVASIRAAYEAGDYVPALLVKDIGEGRFKIIDGHHRYHAGEGLVERYECKDFVGSEADQVATMITSSQGRNLSSTERAKAYLRLHNLGFTHDEIAKKCKRSRADIDNHMTLATSDHTIFSHVESGSISMSEANQIVRKKGDKAVEIIDTAVTKAKESGERKVKATDLHRFTNKMAMRFVELTVNGGDDNEMLELANAYRKSIEC
jgi:ParB family transcriptional regulator, chromosome partitioning protein